MSKGDCSKEHILNVATKIKDILKPCCDNIEIAGSIRRQKAEPHDIDVVLIPKNKDEVISILNMLGTKESGGEKKAAWIVDNVKVELYFATKGNWGSFLLMYTGSKEYNISMRYKAKKMGLMLNQYGLFKDGFIIAFQTEEDIFKALDMKYVAPEMR